VHACTVFVCTLQVTFLHLFHHLAIAVLVGSVLPFAYSDDMYLPILANSLTHVLVYCHYILTGLGMHAWWSPYLTLLQVRFHCTCICSSQLLVWYNRQPNLYAYAVVTCKQLRAATLVHYFMKDVIVACCCCCSTRYHNVCDKLSAAVP
jgi:GNS1/SUR4 family